MIVFTIYHSHKPEDIPIVVLGFSNLHRQSRCVTDIAFYLR